jgi:hypothetical protein
MHPARACRWVLTAAAAAGLLAWTGSYRWSCWAYSDTYCARLIYGTFVYGTYERLILPDAAPTLVVKPARPDDDRHFFCHEAQVRVPLWSLTCAAAGTAAALWWPVMRRRPAGRCACCGYSRAGLASSSCCPECGHAPTAPARHP